MNALRAFRSPNARRVVAAWLLASLAACGGGGGSGGGSSDSGDTTAPLPPLGAGESAYADPVAYSSAAGGSLDGAVEAAAVTKHTLAIGATQVAYTAHAGHLIARRPADGAAEASLFYVAYTADGADPATRPVTVFYNGGPGSASVWLHLGSFGPKRLATGVPATTTPQPFAIVDNAESLLDSSDLVFVDAVGTGLSTAIKPFTNQSFWGVDADAELFRDAIVRWLGANGRGGSPLFLYGESYGGPRTAVLARRLQEAGVVLAGLLLQSPALDYNSNCGVIGSGNCAPYLPSYASVGAYHGVAPSYTGSLDGYAAVTTAFADQRLRPAIDALPGGTPFPSDLPPLLAGYTGIAESVWRQQPNLFPGNFRFDLLPNAQLGAYDGRIVGPLNGDEPSNALIEGSFQTGIATLLHETLRYDNASTYVLLSDAIEHWNFGHAGQPLPDTVPDLAAALAADPLLTVLAMSGYHDLVTPFHLTELDLARIGGARVQLRNYAGGHMSYLDDATRARQKADVAAYLAAALQAAPLREARRRPLAAQPAADRAGSVPTLPQRPLPQAAIQTPLRDPAVPPALRKGGG